MGKRSLILNALEELIIEDKGAACSVSDIAKEAGIGKGSIYYYFKSKEEIMDALVERNYGRIIEKCKEEVEKSTLPALEKFKLLFACYYSSNTNNFIDHYLHETQNAYLHQKSLSKIHRDLTPILTSIVEEGIKEGSLTCPYPKEFSELILSELVFLFDPGLFQWTPDEIKNKLQALAEFAEILLGVEKGSFGFLKEFRS